MYQFYGLTDQQNPELLWETTILGNHDLQLFEFDEKVHSFVFLVLLMWNWLWNSSSLNKKPEIRSQSIV